MFTFCVQKDTIRIEPRDFGKDPAVALREEIHRRYANKVIPEVGLCISLLDILDASEGAVLYGDGCFYYKAEFRLIIFRPHVGEAFVAKVQQNSEEGIKATLGFFDDIAVTPPLLPEFSCFDATERAWFWVPPTDNEDDPSAAPVRPTNAEMLKTPHKSRLWIKRKDYIRIRVEEEIWQDESRAPILSGGGGLVSGMGLGLGATAGGTGEAGSVGTVNGSGVKPGKPPYSLLCSMAEPGSGPLDWWEDEEEEEEGVEP